MPLTYTWLPAAQPDPTETPLQIIGAEGSHIINANGDKIYDAISSWWCKPLGHRHPLVIKSIHAQLAAFEHHIPANAWNNVIEELSQRLVNIFTQMDKVIYASDGSSAVEIAMKLSYETRVLAQQPEKSKFIALAGAYHGETIFTLAVCGIANYTANYQALLQQNYFIDAIPYVTGASDPLWSECNFNSAYWETFFAAAAPNSTALIIEPLVQGAAGMKIISRDFLIKLIALAKSYGLHIIADEIMVGLGRLGCHSVTKEWLNCEPDLVCFAKNLTAGSIPMSAVVVNRSISNVFRDHKQLFPHSHTHSGNALAAAVALNYLQWLDDAAVFEQVRQAEITLSAMFAELQANFSCIHHSRVIGAIAACELNLDPRVIAQVFACGLQENIYLRPIGNTLYLLPPIYNLQADLALIKPQLYRVLQRLTTLQHARSLVFNEGD